MSSARRRLSAALAAALAALAASAAPARAARVEAPETASLPVVAALAPADTAAAAAAAAAASQASAAGLPASAAGVPASADASLRALAAGAAPETAQAGSSAAAEQAAGRWFDGERARSAGALAAAAVAVPAVPAAAPAVYALARHALSRRPAAPVSLAERRERLSAVVEAHVAVLVPMTLAAAFVDGLLHGSALLPAAVAGMTAVAATAMEDHAARLRQRVVGGWQASHDQKFRVDPATGRLKDVRGRKIGEDRYEIYAPGEVTSGERAVMRLAAVAAAAFWLHAVGAPHLWVFAVLTTGALLLTDVLRARPKEPFVPSSEDLAHARRFEDKKR